MTKNEELVISLLEKVAQHWPKGLTLFSAAGRLMVIRNIDKEILTTINIPNDGGDPGSKVQNGKDYLCLD